VVASEVLGRKQPALGFHKRDDLPGDVADIERASRRFEPGIATPPGGGLFLVDHVLQ